jgi:predicted ArsR family transcriptional regulator
MSPPLLAIRSALLDPKAKEGLSSQQIADQIGIATRTVRTHMAKLAGQGLVRAIGKNARDPGRRYLWISR